MCLTFCSILSCGSLTNSGGLYPQKKSWRCCVLCDHCSILGRRGSEERRCVIDGLSRIASSIKRRDFKDAASGSSDRSSGALRVRRRRDNRNTPSLFTPNRIHYNVQALHRGTNIRFIHGKHWYYISCGYELLALIKSGAVK